MSGSRPHRHRVPHLRAQLVLGAAAVICAALTAGQALLPVLASAHPGGHDARQGATAADRRHHGTPPDPDQNCTLIVPPAPLSAAGLATPYRFIATNPRAGACHEANAEQSAFVEAAILDPAGARFGLPPARDRRRDAARDPAGSPPCRAAASSACGSASRRATSPCATAPPVHGAVPPQAA